MKAEKPTAPPVIFDSIPAELKDRARWIGWRYKDRDGKWAKVPVSCISGRSIAVTKAGEGVTFDQAVVVIERHKLDGLGFAFDQDGPFTGIDLDDSRDPETSRLYPWTDRIVRELNSYSEVSPSGTGVHIILKGKKPLGSRSRKGNIEVYDQGRYFTMTGKRLDGTPATVEARQAPLEAVLKRLSRTDEDIVRMAKEAANGDKFRRLWNGDWVGYNSVSEADMALCGMLAYWTDGDAARVDALFGRSELGRREKWSGRPDYRAGTIERAIRGSEAGFLTRGTRNNQITRNNQEQPRSKHCTTASAVVIPPLEDRQGISVGLALKLADERGNAKVYESSFDLARRLRTLSDDHPEQYEAAARAFCEKTGQDYEHFWYAFNASWPKVRMAEGDDILAWAFNMAKAEPYPLPLCLGPAHGHIASMAWHLSRHTNPEPFFLPVKRLKVLLDAKHLMVISNAIDLLKKANVIKCVNDNYCFRGKNRRAKEYRFIGPSLTQSYE